MDVTVKDLVLDHIDHMSDEIIEFAKSLIAIPTVNPPGENYEKCAKLILKRIEGSGLSADLIEVPRERLQELAPHGMGLPRPNILGRLEGMEGRPVLHLNGHFDVVPAGAGWTREPFKPSIEGDTLYGRGAADQKCGLAAAIMATKAIKESGVKLKGSLTLSATPDEETGGLAGLGFVVNEGFVKADLGIVTEPSGIDGVSSVEIGHRGALWLEIEISGKAAHGSQPFLGVNAFEKMVELATALRSELQPKFRARRSVFPVRPSEGRYPTINLGGVASCGVKVNVVPDRCVFTVDRRLIPEEKTSDALREIDLVIKRLKRTDKQLKVKVKTLARVEATILPAKHMLVRTVKKTIEDLSGRRPRIFFDTGYDDRRFLSMAGIPALVYGPGMATDCHIADERCSIKDLIFATKVLALTTLEMLGHA